MAVAGKTDVGGLVVAEAAKLIGAPSAHHSKFHTGVFTSEQQEEQLYLDPEAVKQLQKWLAGNATARYTAHRQEAHLPHSSETGLDCSGLVNIAITEVIRILNLTGGMFQFGEFLADCKSERFFSPDYSPPKMEGEKITVPRHVKGFYVWGLTAFVQEKPLKAGDILFTHTNGHRNPPSHIGIYYGEGGVIHSPGREGSEVGKVCLEEFTRRTELPPFYGGLVAVKRLTV